jgi:pSer/pThr/pTyr-binding forkhead associated (FHA) protein
MNSLSAAPPLTSHYVLKIIGGPNKGATYKLITGQATLGRDTGNDINLNDSRCSQQHMSIQIQNSQVFVKDLNSRNGISVNGIKVPEAFVKPGDQVQLGDTILTIQKEMPIAPLSTKLSSTNFPNVPSSQGSGLVGDLNPKILIVGLALIGLVVTLLISSSGKKKRSDYGLRTEEQVNAELQDIENRKTELARQKVSSAGFSEQGKEAQAAYLQGFRDYREGNFSRAIQSFTAALALYPDHALAQQYKKLSERRLDELVQLNLQDGKRNMEQNKYEMARSNYRNVLYLVNDQTSKTYQEASGQLQIIELLLTGRY